MKKLFLSSLLSLSLCGLSPLADAQLVIAGEDGWSMFAEVDDEGWYYYPDEAFETSDGTIIEESDESLVESGDVGSVAESGAEATVLYSTESLGEALIGLGSILILPLACTAADIWYYDETSETNPELLCLTYAAAPYDGNATYCWNDGDVGTCS